MGFDGNEQKGTMYCGKEMQTLGRGYDLSRSDSINMRNKSWRTVYINMPYGDTKSLQVEHAIPTRISGKWNSGMRIFRHTSRVPFLIHVGLCYFLSSATSV